MPRLFLIRHGEPEAAWGGDRDDPGLSERGWAQAAAAAEALAQLGPLAILTSPMRRCRETAAPYVAHAGQAPRIEPLVSEVRAPPEVADRRAWLLENFPWRGGPARLWSELDPHLGLWREALLGGVRQIGADSAVFTHFIAINVIAGAALGRKETIVCRPDYASITEVEVATTGLRLVRHGAEMGAGEVR